MQSESRGEACNCAYSGEIERTAKDGKTPDAVARTTFQNEYFSGIDGLIWSKRSTGNFLGKENDLVFVHNQLAKRPLPRRWLNWSEEFFSLDNGRKLRRI